MGGTSPGTHPQRKASTLSDQFHRRYDGVRKYMRADAIATRMVFRDEFTYWELYALALEVASGRYELWDAGAFPPGTDLRMHLRRAVRTDRYIRGWRQITNKETGKREWVIPREHVPIGRDIARLGTWETEPHKVIFGEDDAEPYKLAADWPSMTKGDWRRFAPFMEARYPEVCDAFEAVDQQARPKGMHRTAWAKELDRARALLRVRFARELAEARFGVTYGGLMAVAA